MASVPKRHVSCPMCGWCHPLVRTGRSAVASGKYKGPKPIIFRFGTKQLDEFPVMRWMISHGNSGKPGDKCGFETVKKQTIVEMLGDPSAKPVIDDIYARAKELVEVIDANRKKV